MHVFSCSNFAHLVDKRVVVHLCVCVDMRVFRRLFSSHTYISDFLNQPPELIRLSSIPSVAAKLPVGEEMKKIIQISESIHQLKLQRMTLLSLPAHSVAGRNRELLSLGVGAVSGALSLSIHPAFALVFFVSYRMYKSANKPTTDRLESPKTVRGIMQEIACLDEELAARLAALRMAQAHTEYKTNEQGLGGSHTQGPDNTPKQDIQNTHSQDQKSTHRQGDRFP